MSFLSRWFGSGRPLDEISKASKQGRWADVLNISSTLNDSSLTENDRVELREFVDTAAEKLSRINFEEALASLRAEDFHRGMEHLDLARELARSSELRKIIDAEFDRIGNSNNEGLTVDTHRTASSSCVSSCCGTAVTRTEASIDLGGDFDEETRFDLILTAYPPELRPRYLEVSTLMRQAILLAHEGKGDEALALFFKVLENERKDIYHYELGALFARRNQYSDAVEALQQAISMNPAFVIAAMTLVDLHIVNKNYAAADNLLAQMLNAQCLPDYCHARFAVIFQAQGSSSKAFEHAATAIALGHSDPELMVFVARALEDQGRIEEAEGVLSSIPVGGGCSGGANVELAEFWLRHKKNLQKSLEIFKNAAKGDLANPLWGYHIARVYLALGWTKEAKQILETFVNADSLDGALRENAIQLLRSQT